MDQIPDQLFSFATDEQLLSWEDTAIKVAKYAGYTLAIFAGIGVAVLDGFPLLLTTYSYPLFIATSLVSTAFVVYTMYTQKLENIRNNSTESIIKAAETATDFQDDEETKHMDLGAKVKVLTLDNNKTFAALDSDAKTAYFAKIARYFPNLTTLNLKGVVLDDKVDISPLGRLPLESLKVTKATLSDTQLGAFGANDKLKILSLHSCNTISEAALKAFANAPLEELELVHCRLDPSLDYTEADKNVMTKLTADPQKMMENFQHRDKFLDEELHFDHIPKKKFAILHQWKELKTLKVSHINDKAVKALFPALPKLETFQIEHSLALTGECFSQTDIGAVKHLEFNKCYSLNPAVFTSLCAHKTLEKVTFYTDPAECIGLKDDAYEREYKNFRKHFKAPDKIDDIFTGMWIRKKMDVTP
ncbi:MAG: hypothetical protein WC222_08495 [Parachlamydiales bacterium]|jgi:hypothetical protein